MKYFFVKSPVKIILVLLVTLFTVLIFSAVADATFYDDFTSSGIDQGKWTVTSNITGAGTGFTQPGDGYLYYRGVTPVNEKLTSTEVFPSGIFTMPFADYSSNNNAPPAQGLGSVVAIGLGSQSSGKWVRIERGQIQDDPEHGIIGGYIEVNWVLPTNPNPSKIYVNYVQSDITSGALQLRYDGTDVTFFYRIAKTSPWTQMVRTGQGGKPVLDAKGQAQPLVITPGWTTEVPLFIQSIPGGADGIPSYTLSFKVNYVNIYSAPVADVVDSLQNIITRINDLETGYFKNASMQKALTKKLHVVVRKVEQGFYTDALDKLQNHILQKTNGCAAKGRPDKNDWITDCAGQGGVYPIIIETASSLKKLI